MHLGNVFSALLAWLCARAADGALLLRIEDLDPERCRPEYAAQLRDDLRWLGLDWDAEGTPQSLRSDAYEEAFSTLAARGLLYPCYCTRAALHAASAPHASDGTPVYTGTCRNLTEAQRAAQTRRPAWRVLVPDAVYGVDDRLQGRFEENLARDCGDFILRRSDGVFAYQLAVVVDDALMGVTQVVRGRDLLDSTPRQLYLYRLLGYLPPDFGHIPLLLDPAGARLSKRDAALDLGVLRKRFSAQEILGILACAGGLLDRPEPVAARELIPLFAWEKLPRKDVRLPASLWE